MEKANNKNGIEMFWERADELLDREYIIDFDENTIQENDYTNIFNVNGKTFYTWSW